MKIRRIILFFFLALFLIAVYAAWGFFGPTIQSPEGKFFYIHTGASYQQVKDSLKKNKIIGTGFWFDKVSTYSHYDKNVKAGKYKITDGMSVVNPVSYTHLRAHETDSYLVC